MHPLVLVGLGVRVGEGLGLVVWMGLGNQAAISTKGCIIWGASYRQSRRLLRAGVGNPRLFHPSAVAPCSVVVQYAGEMSPQI